MSNLVPDEIQGTGFYTPMDLVPDEKPTPSKEPSVDETLKDYHHRAMESVKLMVKKQMLASHAAANEVVARREAKSQLLALHLGCLPGKMAVPINVRSFNNGMSAITTNPYKEGEIKGHNSAVDLIEQKLREMYGKT